LKKSGSVEWLTAYDKRTESRCAADSARGGGGVGRGRKLDRALNQTVARPAKYSAHLRGPLDFAEACRVACSRRSSGPRVRVLEIAASHSGDVPSQKSTCSQANLKKISQARRPLNKSTAIAIYAGAGCAGARERGSHYGGVTAGANDPHISLQGLRRVLTVLA